MKRGKRGKRGALAVLFASLLVSGLAWADIPPPEAEACKDKKAGDVCDMPGGTQKGICTDSTCRRAGPDGGSSYACLLCKVATTDGGPKPTVDSGPKPIGVDGPPPKSDTGTPVTKPAEDDSGCVVGGSTARVVGPWLLCLGFAALLLVLGRRRRR